MICIVTQNEIPYVNGNHSINIDLTRCKYLSPFYAWGDIPVPYSGKSTAISLVSLWEGLKVFENADIDCSLFKLNNVFDVIRSEAELGRLIGYRRGIYGNYIFSEEEALKNIFVRTYRWILEHKVYKFISYMRTQSKENDIIFYEGCSCNNYCGYKLPVSIAALLKDYIEGIGWYKDVKNKTIIYRYYCGRSLISWKEEIYKFAKIPPEENISNQLTLDFDF